MSRLQAAAGALALIGAAACSSGPRVGPKPEAAVRLGELSVVAEGPCAKLSLEAIGERRFLVYGDTGYELSDWAAGERLAAAQSLVEITKDGVFRNRAMLEGLPEDARGYVPASLELGADSTGAPWLLTIDTRYAPRGTGALFERSPHAYAHKGDSWRRAASDDPLDLGPGTLPDIPTSEACESPGLHFVALTHAFTSDGGVLVAGRCQDESHIAYADTTLVVAHARKGASAWDFARLPRSSRLDGIVNVALFGRTSSDAWLTAFEPYAAIDGRASYLVHFDGAQWHEVDIEVDEGLMSVAGDASGAIYLAAGRGLYKRDARGVVSKLSLPPLRYVAKPAELHIQKVRAFPEGELWVEAAYRVTLAMGEHGEPRPVWASALFSNVPLPRPLYCDAREPAALALSEIDDRR